MYLQNGIGWFPNYLVEIQDNGKAKLKLRSLVVNDTEDIDNVELSFVVGVPNFRYNYVASPLTSMQTLKSFVSSLSYSSINRGTFDNSGVFSNAIMSQTTAMPEEPTMDNTSYSYSENEFTADVSNQEDLYFYKYEDVNMKKGERATFELLNTEVPYEHVYEVDLQSNNRGYYSYYSDYSDDNTNKVWHSIKLENTSQIPWTTGTAMVIKNEDNTTRPISQDMLKYTPVKSKCYLKITISPDISVKDKEKEINRLEKNKRKDNSYYDLVTVEGSILIKNYKDDAIKLNINRNIAGILKESSVKWEYTKIPGNYYYINSTNQVSWIVNLKPKEEKEITYSYTIYLYH